MIDCALKGGPILDQNPREISASPRVMYGRNFISHCGRILHDLILLMHKSLYTWKVPKREAFPLENLAMKGNGKVSMLPIFSTLDELYISELSARGKEIEYFSTQKLALLLSLSLTYTVFIPY